MNNSVVLFNPDSRIRKRPWLSGAKEILPMNLLAISGPLLKSGYRVRIIDQRVEPDWKKLVLRELEEKPVCFGISLMGGNLAGSALETARLVKENSDTAVVFGGSFPSLLPEQTLGNEYIDAVISGDGEEAFLDLAGAIKNKTALDKIRGIHYKEGGAIKSTPRREYADLNNCPAFPYHLLDMKKYILCGPGYRMTHFVSSRGCNFKCSFCYHHHYSPDWRALSAEETVARVGQLKEGFGINGIYFLDADFFFDLERSKRILEGFIAGKLNAPFHTMQMRAGVLSRLDKDFLRLLEKGGVTSLVIGAESGSEKVLKLLNKEVDIRQLIENNKRLADFNIHPHYTFMLGFPSETKEDLRKTSELFLRLIKDNKRANCSTSFYRPVCGTDLFKFLISCGLKVPRHLEEWRFMPPEDDTGNDKPWIDRERRRLLINLRFLSIAIFSAKKNIEYKQLPILRRYLFQWLSNLYFPIARARMGNFNFHFFIERFLARLLIGHY